MKILMLAVLTASALSGCASPGCLYEGSGFASLIQTCPAEQEAADTQQQEKNSERQDSAWAAFVASNPNEAAATLATARHNKARDICRRYTIVIDGMTGQALPSTCGAFEALPTGAPMPPDKYVESPQIARLRAGWIDAVNQVSTALTQERANEIRQNEPRSSLACQWEPGLPAGFEAQVLASRGCTADDITISPYITIGGE